jgi:hypothetical protein
MYMPEHFNKTERPAIAGTLRFACTRGVVVLVACLSIAACGRMDRKKFDATYRAGKILSTATDRGVGPVKYRELVTSFEAQISVVRRRASDEDERDLVDQFDDALKAYRAALAVWTLKIDGQSDWLYSGPGLEELLKPYDIPFGEGPSGLKRLSAENAMKEIWRIAKAKLEVANSTYSGNRRL